MKWKEKIEIELLPHLDEFYIIDRVKKLDGVISSSLLANALISVSYDKRKISKQKILKILKIKT